VCHAERPIAPWPDNRFLVEFPADFQMIRRADPALAITWRLHLRSICEAAFAAGFTVLDCVHSPEPPLRSFYVMQQIESSESGLNA